jgi:DNA helicase IV
LLVEAISKNPTKRYDVILCDEAQDFSRLALRALRHHAHDNAEFIFILDTAQRLYPRGFTWKESGFEIRSENSHTLKQNFRNTVETINFLKPIYKALDIGDDGFIPEASHQQPNGKKPLLLKGKYGPQLGWLCLGQSNRVDILTFRPSLKLNFPFGNHTV